MEITGGCLCGAVRYRATAAPVVTRACWCRLCQYIGAGSGTVNVVFPKDAVTITGELRDFASTADSGNLIHRRFCPQCGTHLFAATAARPHLVVIRIGTLDDPEIAKPDITIWTAAAPTWACFDPALPQFEGQPPPVA
ncbi:MAG: GFA family protein [Rhodospirillaceae bacterium]|nr:MAG: GFA family protein [Rhodospirillaceae bacterium]